MQGTAGFDYGLLTPLAAYLMACLGAALGLRCVVRTVHAEKGRKAAWLGLGAAALGCGIWSMHFIAMIGFSAPGANITYDAPLTVLSLLVAIVMVCVGMFIVGYRGVAPMPLATAGVITGLGVAVMHYLGMAAMHVNGTITYDNLTVALSVIIAVVAATAALWAAVSIRGFVPALVASLVMGVAVTGMHYTGMAAVDVHVHSTASGYGDDAASLVLPMLLGPAVFLILAAVVVMFDPLLVAGDEQEPAPRLSRPRTPVG
ncbi:MHYT domain-containing protein [Streptomyces sp. NPDC004100]